MPRKKVAEKKEEKKVERMEEKKPENFGFRFRLGDYEVELNGTYEEVTKTIENLPNLAANINKALEIAKPKTVATLTVKTEPSEQGKPAQKVTAQTYPKIVSPADCDQAILRLLETEWGKWRPRTEEELGEAMKANQVKYTERTLTKTLNTLADKGKVRRWNTNTGFVYILAEKKSKSGGNSS